MKRHPALVPLSRDHHRALLLAQGLRVDGPPTLQEALPRDASARARHTLAAFETELAPHFALEEAALLPALAGHDAALDAAIARVREEHDALRARIAALRDALEADAAAERIDVLLDAFGVDLVAHVRAEERGLFETAQRVFGDAELARRLAGLSNEPVDEAP